MKTMILLMLVLLMSAPAAADRTVPLFESGDEIVGGVWKDGKGEYALTDGAFIDMTETLNKRYDSLTVGYDSYSDLGWLPVTATWTLTDNDVIADQTLTWYDRLPYKHISLAGHSIIRNVWVIGERRVVGVPNEAESFGQIKSLYQ